MGLGGAEGMREAEGRKQGAGVRRHDQGLGRQGLGRWMQMAGGRRQGIRAREHRAEDIIMYLSSPP